MEMRVEIFYKNAWKNITKGVMNGVSMTDTFDETLDSGGFRLWSYTISDPIEPFTLAKITSINEQGTASRYYYCYSQCTIHNNMIPNKPLWDHNVYLIEITKILERYYLNGKTFSYYPDRPYTIYDVVRTILDTTDPVRAEVTQFNNHKEENFLTKIDIIRDNQKEWNTTTREFAFTTESLFEALLQVAKSVQALPSLSYNGTTNRYELRFTFFTDLTNQKNLDQNKMFNLAKMRNMSDYASFMETDITNLISEDNQGAMTFITTPRNIGDVEISQDTAKIVFPSNMPIYKLNKVVLKGLLIRKKKYVGGETGDYDVENLGYFDVDITKYVLEKPEWDIKNIEDKVKYLVYERLGNTIYNLNYTIPIFAGIQSVPAFETVVKNSILNNPSIVFPFPWVYHDYLPKEYKNIKFEINYTPISDARVRHYRDKLGEFQTNQDVGMYINQSGANVSNFYSGENVRGTLARSGNIDVTKSFYTKSLASIPKKGSVVDGYYLASTTVLYQAGKIKCSMVLTKSFNKLSQLVGLDSALRLFKIPTESITRKLLVNSFIKVGTSNIKVGTSNRAITGSVGTEGLKTIMATFDNRTNQESANFVVFRGFDGGIDRGTFVLPVISLGWGNTIELTSSFKDNRSVGIKSISKNNNYAIAQDVPYTNADGKLDYLGYTFLKNIPSIDSVAIVQNFPLADPDLFYDDIYHDIISSGGYDFFRYIAKDGREALQLTHQLHFISQDEDIIIGSSLIHQNKLITTDSNVTYFVKLKNKIGRLDNYLVDNSNIVSGSKQPVLLDLNSPNYKSIRSPFSAVENDFNAWAIIDNNNKLFLVVNSKEDNKKVVWFSSSDVY